LSPEDAKKWYSAHKDSMRTIELQRPPNKVLTINIPVTKEKVKSSSAFSDYINGRKIETRMQTVLNQLLDEYDVDASGLFCKREKKKAIKKEDY
jgi:hypothetical protein